MYSRFQKPFPKSFFYVKNILSLQKIIKNIPQSTWLHQWIFYITSGFLFGAAALRAILIFQDEPYLGSILLVFIGGILLFTANIYLPKKFFWSSIIIIVAEASLIMLLLISTEQDFFACLFAILGMQAMQKFSPRFVIVLIFLHALLTFGALLERIGLLQALALSLVYTTLGSYMAGYIWITRKASNSTQQEQILLEKLQATNESLEFHANRLEQLATSRERQRLARELHDSVTQTIFSMTLTSQSAIILLERDPLRVPDQLNRLDQLAEKAMSEIQELISRLTPEIVSGTGLINALKHHLDEHRRINSLDATMNIEGSGELNPTEEAGLFRIAQEALNNVVKHAGVLRVEIRLNLTEPAWIEIVDHGSGFNLKHVSQDRMGLSGMRERAEEIGWGLNVESSPGKGTQVRVERGVLNYAKR